MGGRREVGGVMGGGGEGVGGRKGGERGEGYIRRRIMETLPWKESFTLLQHSLGIFGVVGIKALHRHLVVLLLLGRPGVGGGRDQ